jgi:hypothetical protein
MCEIAHATEVCDFLIIDCKAQTYKHCIKLGAGDFPENVRNRTLSVRFRTFSPKR